MLEAENLVENLKKGYTVYQGDASTILRGLAIVVVLVNHYIDHYTTIRLCLMLYVNQC